MLSDTCKSIGNQDLTLRPFLLCMVQARLEGGGGGGRGEGGGGRGEGEGGGGGGRGRGEGGGGGGRPLHKTLVMSRHGGGRGLHSSIWHVCCAVKYII